MSRHFEWHIHDEGSVFDGLGKPMVRALRAKELGYTALAITNHGQTMTWIEHHNACREVGIKPILGVEAYYQPEFDKLLPSYHLTLVAKNLQGYFNINQMMTIANEEYFYRKPRITFELLEKYSEGVICSTACIGGYFQQLIMDKKEGLAKKELTKFKKLFGNDLLVEIMPFKVDENRTQEVVNEIMYDWAIDMEIRCIMTTDAHFTLEEDIETHRLMFDMAGRSIGDIYVGRFMHEEKQLLTKIKKMHSNFDADVMLRNIQKVANEIEDYDLNFSHTIPTIDWGMDSLQKLKDLLKSGLREKGCWKQEYFDRIKIELDVIVTLGVTDYFLVVYDIIKWCGEKDIPTGCRGSVGNSLVAYALGISLVDPVIMGNIFDRFLRKDKMKLPDIDIDVSSRRRGEVIDYITEKYEGRTAFISNRGTYQTKNLINDLMKHIGKLKEYEPTKIENDTKEVKELLEEIVGERDRTDLLNYDDFKDRPRLMEYNQTYDNVIVHFVKLWGQIKFVGRHAGGIIITNDKLSKYTALFKKSDNFQSVYDMNSLDDIKLLKLDLLGVNHYDIIHDIEKRTNEVYDYDKVATGKHYDILMAGNTDGIFQLETPGATAKLKKMNPDSINDIVALTSVNRPGANFKAYVEGKKSKNFPTSGYHVYTRDSYGAIIYQEQVMQICREYANMEWKDTDRIIKIVGKDTREARELRDKFVDKVKDKMSFNEATELYSNMTKYLFNKGHAGAYSIIGAWETYLKYHHPIEFYWSICRNLAGDQKKKDMKCTFYMHNAICNDIYFLRPHVNKSSNFEIEDIDGGQVIRMGIGSLKGIGDGTANLVEKLQPYASKKDFVEKHKNYKPGKGNGRITVATIEILDKAGAFEMDENKHFNSSMNYNAILKRRDVKLV